MPLDGVWGVGVKTNGSESMARGRGEVTREKSFLVVFMAYSV